MTLLKTVSEKLSAWRRYRETISELEQLSDHELHDIGVHRGEIEYIARSFRPPARSPRNLRSADAMMRAAPRGAPAPGALPKDTCSCLP